MRQRSWERYEQIVRVHIEPTLGRAKLKTLNPAQVRALYRERLEGGSSPRTVQYYVHVTLHKALERAQGDGLVARNAAKGIKVPRPRKKEIAPLTPDRARAFLKAARGDRFEALFVLALHCGLREGELLGLRWDDVDLEAGTLRVRRTLSETRDGPIFEPPKNGKGRNVPLTGAAVEALRDHLARRIRAWTRWRRSLPEPRGWSSFGRRPYPVKPKLLPRVRRSPPRGGRERWRVAPGGRRGPRCIRRA